MAKLLNVRERVHQPWRDSLCRYSGYLPGTVQAQTDLFVRQGGDEGITNLKSGNMLANDNSMIILACRNLLWFRNPIRRHFDATSNFIDRNGDFSLWPNLPGQAADGVAPGSVEDVHRLYHQAAEALYWTVGSGDKDALKSMPSMYFPMGGGLHGDLGAASDLILWNNGMPSHSSILRLARAVTIVPRQQIKVFCSAQTYTAGANGALFGTVTAGGRDMLSIVANLNAVDGITKVISFILDGLVSRDVQ